MKRLLATLVCDARLQFRNGFYYAAAVVAFFWIIAIKQFPADSVRWLIPVFILSNLLISTFYFIAGLILLEKGEGTLIAQIVTPLRDSEYLLSKVVTLSILAAIENMLIVLIAFGSVFHLLLLLAGILSASAILVLFGFITVSRYDSINEYLFPSFLFTSALLPPFIDFFGLWKGPILYLHPLQASLELLKAATGSLSIWSLLYGIVYSGLWIFLLFRWSRMELAKFATRVEGES
jgi:fluoroquinolone transport system permease protein